MRFPSKTQWLSAVIILALLAVLAIPFLQVAKWVGSRPLDVYVLVFDSDAMQPVSGAQVTIFDGPRSFYDASVAARKPSEFTPDRERSRVYKTNSAGRCQFSHRFWAAGSEGLLEDTGYVDTARTWLKVSAPGRPSTLISLDRQSLGNKDLHDTSPLFVTVALNQCESAR
jgi:hypothetical protein